MQRSEQTTVHDIDKIPENVSIEAKSNDEGLDFTCDNPIVIQREVEDEFLDVDIKIPSKKKNQDCYLNEISNYDVDGN